MALRSQKLLPTYMGECVSTARFGSVVIMIRSERCHEHLPSSRAGAQPLVPSQHSRFNYRLTKGLAHRVRCNARKLDAIAAATGTATAAAAHPPPPTQDPQVIYQALLAPVASALGGEASWQFYLAKRFTTEVVAVVAAAVLFYRLISHMARRSAEAFEGSGAKRSGGGSSASSSSTAASSLGGSDVFYTAAEAISGPWARWLLTCVLSINVVRNTTYIFDGFITKFNPTLPTDWLDDLVRLIVQGLTPLDGLLTKMSVVFMMLWGCAVLVRVKDIMLAHYLLPYVESMDKGSELVQNFVNTASNLFNWLAIAASAAWIATGLGLNLQPILAVGGASGIIIGLATQQILSNFVSGLNIFLARTFMAGEYITLVGQNVSGQVIRIDPMRTLIVTEDNITISVPNQVIAVSIVVNRSRSLPFSVAQASQLLANPRELRWRMKLPHSALDKLQELEAGIAAALDETLSSDGKYVRHPQVQHSMPKVVIVKFVESGAEAVSKVTLVWRLGGKSSKSASETLERREKQDELIQRAMLAVQKVVRSFDGVLLSAA